MEKGKITAVLGVGPGLGAAVARKFAAEGHLVALMARRPGSLREVEGEIAAAGGRSTSIAADAGDAASVAAAFAEVRAQLGEPDVLVYNAGAFQMGGVLELTPERFEECWRTSCLGAFLAAREVLPAMIRRGRGTLLFTGATASLRGSARFSALAVGKFGLRALAQSIAREHGPAGVHVAHVIIDGQIETPRLRALAPDRPSSTMLHPDAIARTYWDLHRQDPSGWTQELDLRPATEKF